MDYKSYHIPVLLNQLINQFELSDSSIVIDGTLGFAGHAEAILDAHPDIHYIGFDKDVAAIKIASKRCQKFKNVEIINQPFSAMFDIMHQKNIRPTHILLDLGVSSYQIDQSLRGFTFQKDELLDMRMDASSSLTAQSILNNYAEEELIDIFKYQADINSPERLVSKIIQKRQKTPLKTTFDLVECVKNGCFVKSRPQFIAMCTKVFQAIRVEVNSEMVELTSFLNNVIHFPNTTIAIISFQPNEDKLVKAFVKEHQLERITKKPIQASYHEAKKNPREKSAKLRIFKV